MFCVIIIAVFVQGISSANQSFVLSANETVLNVTAGDSFLIVCVHPNEWQENSPVTWLKDEVVMEKDEFPRIIMSNLHLQFERVSRDDAGVYKCDVKDHDGKTRFIRHGTLVVKSKNKKVVEEDYSEEEEIDSDLRDRSMSCEFIEPTLNNNSNNNNSSQLQEQPDKEQEDTTPVAVSDSASVPYLCFDLSSKKKKLMTHYLAKPAGSTVTIFCNARGYPKPTIQWYKNDKPFVSYGYQHRINKQGLLIQDSNPSDSAMYKCEASNGNQTISYEIEYLVVGHYGGKPRITPLVNSTVFEGGNFSMTCVFESDYPFGMAWIKGRNQTNPHIQSRTNDPDLKMDNHVLVLENVTMDDEGWYSCIAVNSNGRSLESAYIRVVTELTEPVKEAVHSNFMLYGIFTLIGFTIFFVTISLVYSMWKRQLRKSHSKPGLNFVKQVMIEHRPVSDDDDRAVMIPEVNIKNVKSNKGGFQEYELPLDLNWEFPRDRLELGKHIGEGAFGICHQAIADGIIQTGVKTIVAVKSLKKTHTDGDMIDLMSEMETMKALGRHTNIINLLGCCTQNGELLVIMEMAQEGNLKDYLRNYCYQFDEHKKYAGNSIIVPVDGPNNNNNNYITEKDPIEKLTFADLMSIAFQVARGMSYLVQKKYVHRDLAARNILMCSGNVVKIADFGMARSTFTNDYYRKKTDGRVPLRWMAPETIFHRIYTTQSDVWSYGVLLWEIVTLGATPYPSMPDVNGILCFLQSGKRMEKPENCPTELYLIMRDCWIESPSSRPSFDDLVEDIGRILTIASGTEYLELVTAKSMIDGDNILTPLSSPEHSGFDFGAFDPDFLKTFA